MRWCAGWSKRRNCRNCSIAKRPRRCAEAANGATVVVYVNTAGGAKIVQAIGCDRRLGPRTCARGDRRRTLRCNPQRVCRYARTHTRMACEASRSSRRTPSATLSARRLRMLTSVARQGFALCAARERSDCTLAGPAADQSLEPVLPGFLSASAAMSRVVDQIQRLQGNDLTVLITGESGTGKELVARAIHVGSHRSRADCSCRTTARRPDATWPTASCSAIAAARSPAPCRITRAWCDRRPAARCFSTKSAICRSDVQPKLLRFLEQSEIMPVGDSRPIKVDVRVIAATNADLEQGVAEGRFREDLYYRLSVIRIHVPPLRERREEIPHLATLFLRESAERLAKPDVTLGSDVLDVFAQYWWPGNVRQLKNEIQRIVAMSAPGRPIDTTHLSPEILATRLPDAPSAAAARKGAAGRADAGRRGGTGRTRLHPRGARQRQRQYLRGRAHAGADQARAVLEAAAPGARCPKRGRDRLLTAPAWISCIQSAEQLIRRYPCSPTGGTRSRHGCQP